ncbi:hypothetical protein HY494_01035 [Candidatus Woesearchaeota archaeon]|nr:hypothetical protein [Candidatus Woesearchaeota archaeon]
MEILQMYKVTTEGDEEGRSTSTLGYAIGCPDVIKAFYDDQKLYRIRIMEISVIRINRESLKEKRDLQEEESNLRKRLGELEKILGR